MVCGERRKAGIVVWPKAAEAGDEAVGVPVVRGGKLPDLDGGAEAFGGDGVLEEVEGVGVQRGAVAEEGVGGDFGDGQVVEGVHGRRLLLGEGSAMGVKAG